MGQETDKDLKKAKHELDDEKLDKVSGGHGMEDSKHLDPAGRRIDAEHHHDDASRLK